MPEILEITAYRFNELSEKAKEKAREWWRDGAFDYEWWDFLFDDFVAVAEILGIEIGTQENGKHKERTIFFSGFSSQGSGACFVGDYSYSKMAHKKIRQYAPNDERLHAIADELFAIQKKVGYSARACMTHRGRYSHEYCMEVSVECCEHYLQPVFSEVEARITMLMRDFARWMYSMLESEYWWRMADEQVDDNIICNEYLFDANGERSVILSQEG